MEHQKEKGFLYHFCKIVSRNIMMRLYMKNKISSNLKIFLITLGHDE
jgi:hypothetical protein